MSTVAEHVSATKTGVNFVPGKEDLNKVRFLVPNSARLISIERQRTPRKPPTHIQFGMVRNRQLRMILPIPLKIERKGRTVVAAWEEIEEFGYGKNISEALDDFGRTLEELFLTLNEKQSTLSDDLARVWSMVSKHIQLTRRGK